MEKKFIIKDMLKHNSYTWPESCVSFEIEECLNFGTMALYNSKKEKIPFQISKKDNKNFINFYASMDTFSSAEYIFSDNMTGNVQHIKGLYEIL